MKDMTWWMINVYSEGNETELKEQNVQAIHKGTVSHKNVFHVDLNILSSCKLFH